MSNISVPATGAPAWWGGGPPGPYTGYTGRNVVIGIIDTGIDLAHADFRTSVNQTRVKYVWDQTVVATPPAGFSYGKEWTEAEINAGTATQADGTGTGTHLAGIAAANGRATGNGYAQYRYVGMAPEADLVIVKCPLSYAATSLMDGATYIFQKAATLGKPCVVLIGGVSTNSKNAGAHDGTTTLDVTLSALTGPGKIIVVGVGDQGGLALHAQINLGVGQSSTTSFTIPAYSVSPSVVEGVVIESWHLASALFDVRLTSPNGITTGWIAPGASFDSVTTDGRIILRNDITTNAKGKKQIFVAPQDGGGANIPAVGTWTIEFARTAAATTGLCDSWVSTWTLGSGNVSPVFTTNINYAHLAQSPATADSVISVGAYTTKRRWTYVGGNMSQYVTMHPPYTTVLDNTDIASFSARGPTLDGRQSPDIAAPGQGVFASMSANAASGILNTFRDVDNVHQIVRGTTVAAAHVAGAVALLLQQYPTIEPVDMRALLAHHSMSDSFTGAVPNATWGNGKLGLRPRCS